MTTSVEAKTQSNSSQPIDQWLVRTSQNLIHGPYSKEEICGFIQGGKLTTLDEVCSATGYWFFLHEVAEVGSQLGVSPPLPVHSPDDEVTETEVHAAAGTLASLAETEEEAQREAERMAEITGTTIMASSEVQSHVQSTGPGTDRERAAAAAVQRAFKRSQDREDGETVEWIRKFESLSFWKTLTIFLVIVTAVLFISIIRLIRD